MLLPRALEPALSPGVVRVEGKHLLQVLKHVVKESATKAALLKLPPLSVHGLPVGLEVAVEVSLLLGVGVGVEVVLVPLMLLLVATEVVVVFKEVVKVEVK